MLNIARNRPATQSSLSSWSTKDTKEQEAGIANSGCIDQQKYCHTGAEFRPWWQVDLDSAHDVGRVVIHNRTGHSRGRLKRFSLLRSLDGVNWSEMYRKSDDSEFDIFTADISDALPARFVRLRLDGHDCLHIRACEIFGEPSDPVATRALLAREVEAAALRAKLPEGKTGHFSEIGGFPVFVDDKYSDTIRRSLDDRNYEGRERSLVARLVKPNDRILEAGTAIGVVSMTAASIVGADRIATFEANPAMVEAARDNFRRNGFERIQSNLAVLANRTRFSEGKTVPFYVAEDFWASRLDAQPDDKGIVATVEVPLACLEDQIRKHDANVLICDIEGGEIDLFDGADLTSIRLIIMETHYGFVGEAATDAMIKNFILSGFALHLTETMQNVVVLRRVSFDQNVAAPPIRPESVRLPGQDSDRALPRELDGKSGETREPKEIVSRFQSLGDNCEFGFVQRKFGVETGDLLRWATAPIDPLVAALNTRFENLYLFDELTPLRH